MNPSPAYEEPPRVRLQWHGGATTYLAGDYRAGYWRGPEGCSPQYPGLKPLYTRSEAVPEGREGISPRRPVAAGGSGGSPRTRAKGRYLSPLNDDDGS